MTILNRLRLFGFLLSVVGFVVVERYLRNESYYVWASATVLAIAVLSTCLAGYLALRPGRTSGNMAQWRKIFLAATAWQAVFAMGMIAFIGYYKLMGTSTVPESMLQKALLTIWLLLLVLSGFAGIGIEFAFPDTSDDYEGVESKRVLRSGVAWLMVGMVLSALVCFNYVGVQRDKVFDWSYLKTTTPSDATVALFNAATDKVEIHIFYPDDNEVRPYVTEYFDYLAKKQSNVSIARHDKDLEPLTAEDLKVSRNGNIVFKQGDKKERLDVGLELGSARKTLKKFDSEVQKYFLKLTSAKKKVYFTTGHGEFSWIGSQKEELRSLDLLETLFRSMNYTAATFGLSDGSGSKVPDDAAALIIVAPDQPFFPQEVDAIKVYLNSGGKLMVFADPAPGGAKETPDISKSKGDPLFEYLDTIGLRFDDHILGNDRNYVQARKSASDRWFLFSNSFSSHESVSSLARNDDKAALVMFQAGSIDTEKKNPDWRVTTTVRSVADTFPDLNRNTQFDEKTEKRGSFAFGAVATHVVKAKDKDGKDIDTEAKVVMFADATAFSDALIKNRANAVFVVDSLKWLTGNAEIMGNLSTEEDIKIQHSNKEDVVWFYSTVAIVPAFVLGIGYFATRRRRIRG